MSENTICLKSIRELLGMRFFIPSYQRGYRWSPLQVDQLLDDINEFEKKNNKEEGEFYCLQPIVVKRRVNYDDYEVIDGQQRLTTIFIILKVLEERFLEDYPDYSLYSLQYETRANSKDFLENLSDTTADSEKYIDFFHMKQAYDTVKQWFLKKENYGRKSKILDFLLNFEKKDDNDVSNNVRVIWYEVDEDGSNSSSIDIFSRLNIGKIPLTNAELIKALFLRKKNFDENVYSLKQIQIATEWDDIEKRLQQDDFWYFISNGCTDRKYECRIEYIFDLMKDKQKNADSFYTFRAFSDELNSSSIDSVWFDVKNYILTFEEWYADPKLYHYVGFLISCGKSVKELKNASESKGKTDFENYLVNEIKKSIVIEDELENLRYSEDNDAIKKILLLFNIQTILCTHKSEMRFPFALFKKESWDVEHVCSQTDKSISSAKDRKEWAEDVSEYLKYNEVDGVADELSLIEALKSENKIDENRFNECFIKFQKILGDDKIIDKDTISNLTLLDAKTNRSYKNAYFPIKRLRIIENDKNGIFVPIATKNLFLKYYSKQAGNVTQFGETDANSYIAAIKETLSEFMEG
ncbi:DUF262 domain-containing protein [Candidatus Saccharibacteria bacterium]|nr:DUF262 domain-containing protein [Candidatus Saccharibacteria bacterium]